MLSDIVQAESKTVLLHGAKISVVLFPFRPKHFKCIF